MTLTLQVGKLRQARSEGDGVLRGPLPSSVFNLL